MERLKKRYTFEGKKPVDIPAMQQKIDFPDEDATLKVTVPVTPRVFLGTADQDGSSFLINDTLSDLYSGKPPVPLQARVIPAGVFISGDENGIY